MMRLIAIGWLFMLMQVNAADTFAQKITLQVKNANLKEVLDKIQKQTQYDFMYNNQQIAVLKPITLSVSGVDLKEVLDACTKENGLEYLIDNRVVIIRKKAVVEKPFTEAMVQQTVQGQVLDEEGNPIKGASIREKANPSRSFISGADGSFILPVTSLNEIFVISFLGYESKEVKASLNRNLMIVRLRKKENEVETVIINTGVFKKIDKSFTGSSRTVTAKELKQFGTRNLITSLRNIDPSFNIIESNAFGSDPNRLPEIQIRGNSNIPNVTDLQNDSRIGLNTPLVILDGFQSSLEKLLDINENDVESITILKDASATAMYGSRGANGVVVITTKQPIGGKLRVNFGSNFNIENPDVSDYRLLKSADKLELERMVGYYSSSNRDNDLSLKRYYNYILSEVNRGVETDWLSIPLRTSFGQRHHIRIEGGELGFRYSGSAQYNNIAGVMKGSNRNTLNGDIMLSYNLKNIRFQNNTKITQGKTSESPYGSFSDYSKLNPYWSPYGANGNVVKKLGDPGTLDYNSYWLTLPTNPLYNATLKTYTLSEYSEILNNTSVEWNMMQDLILRTQFGITKTISQSDRFRPAEHTEFTNYSGNDLLRRGDYQYGVGNRLGYDGSLNLAYNKVIATRHNLYLAGDFNIRQNKSSDYLILAEGFTNPRLDWIGSALQYAKGKGPTAAEDFTRSLGFSANASYNYSNRYFTDFVFRRDGSSQFGAKRKFAPFWSFGLGWNIHEERFLRDNAVVNRLKIRGSTGVVGSQNFSAYQAMTSYKYYSGDNYWVWPGAYLMGLGNDNLLWQHTNKDNIGLDLELLNNRIKVKADVYRERTRNLVSSINLPASNGFPNYIENVGQIQNKGFETQLTLVLLNKPQGLFWSVTGNMIQNRNKVIKTSKAMKEALKSIKNNTTNPGLIYEEGYSSNTIWVVPSLGIDPSNGKELFLDINGNTTYIWSGNDVVAAGSTEAKLFGNFSTMVRYKNFSVNTVFRYTTGGQQYNSTLAERVESSSYKYQMDERVFYSRWKAPGDETAFRGLFITTATNKTSRFVQDEKTWILSNVNLQYDFRDQNWIKRLGLSNLNLTGNISEPMYMSTIRRERGTSYPFSRQFSFSFNATF